MVCECLQSHFVVSVQWVQSVDARNIVHIKDDLPIISVQAGRQLISIVVVTRLLGWLEGELDMLQRPLVAAVTRAISRYESTRKIGKAVRWVVNDEFCAMLLALLVFYRFSVEAWALVSFCLRFFWTVVVQQWL